MPDLIFALVGPVGCALDEVEKELEDNLKRCGYETLPIRISKLLIKSLGKDFEALLEGLPEYERLKLMQDGGDLLRCQKERGDALALLAAEEMAKERAKHEGSRGRAFVIRSLKHPDEVKLLRAIYQDRFYMIAASSPEPFRLQLLENKLGGSQNGGQDLLQVQAKELMARDNERGDRFALDTRLEPFLTKEREASLYQDLKRLGQKLQQTFHLSDLFVDTSKMPSCARQVKRFVEIIFRYPFHTPTRDEFAMFQAKAASLRSADLSRQVGAAIASKEGDIIAVGTNEVPRRGGGLYWEDVDDDQRDFRFFEGQQNTDAVLEKLIQEAVDILGKEGWELKHKEGTLGKKLKALKDVKLMGINEFGRTVHAEMAAIMDAAARGVPIKGQTLFVTTFPCHTCAKHVVASGIARVVFIEPYPKSEAINLWPSEITSIHQQGPSSEGDDRVRFEPFVGIAPRRYFDFFAYDNNQCSRREVEGHSKRVASWKPTLPKESYAHPETPPDLSYLNREAQAILKLSKTLDFTQLLESKSF